MPGNAETEASAMAPTPVPVPGQPFGCCPHCESPRLERPFPGEHPWLVRCGDCGLALASPQPDEAEWAAIYDEHYYEQFGFSDADAAARSGLALTKQRTYDWMLRQAEPHVPPTDGPRRLLDAGCGLGYSLRAAAGRGWQALGLDPLAPDHPEERTSGEPEIVRGSLDDHRPDRPYHLVSLIDAIEHVRDPVATLRRAAELLVPGGVLLLATPDVESLAARRLGPRWVHFHRAHLWYFGPRSLSTAVERAGLVPRRVRTAWRVYNLDYVCSILADNDNSPVLQRIARWILRWVPRPLRTIPWPPVPEGMVLVATRP